MTDTDPTADPVADDAVVRARALGKTFGAHTVLHDLDLDIGRGDFVALVGRSGTGKTTLLRILAGLDSGTSGHVTVTDRTSVVFQEPRLIAAQRVWKNVVLADTRAKEAYQKACAGLAEVGLDAKAKRWPKTLSGGEAQRVGLARALFTSPELLLLDEPFGALDAFTRVQAQRLVVSLWQSHRPGVLLVTHDIEEAISLADRVLVLGDGEVRGDLAVDLPRPRDITSAGFNQIKRSVIELLGDRTLSMAGATGDEDGSAHV